MRFRDFCENQNALHQQLYALRPQLAQAAQQIYDQWEPEDENDVGGICDEISNAMSGLIASHVDVQITDGGHDGDDHAYPIVYNDTEAYAVDIPPYVYERGGGYVWHKIPGVTITANDVVIEPVDRNHVAGDHW